MEVLKNKKVAIVCDWLTNMGGAEKVILSLHDMFPEAPIYTTLYDKQRTSGFEKATVYTSFLQRIPFSQKKHPLFLNSMPLAIESFNLNDYDLVISSSHAVAKGVITKPDTSHICYCHTPMRYAWEPWELESRLKAFPKFMHNNIKKKIHKLRLWDRLTADRVDHFIVNSSYIAERVNKYYRRDSTVIYPPVDTNKFHISKNSVASPLTKGDASASSSEAVGNYFLMVGRLIPYKKFDLVIETFNKLNRPLIIVGTGPEQNKLKKLAKKNIVFKGRVSDEELKTLYNEALALIFPQLEDFGITPVEAMASGRPVVSYSEGGSRDTVIAGKTGVFFQEQTVDSLSEALAEFNSLSWDSDFIKNHAEKFSDKRFQEEMFDFISKNIS